MGWGAGMVAIRMVWVGKAGKRGCAKKCFFALPRRAWLGRCGRKEGCAIGAPERRTFQS